MFIQSLSRFAAPVLLLAAAFTAVLFGDALAPALGGWTLYGPYLALAAGAALALAFDSGRAFFALVTLLAAYAAQQHGLDAGLGAPGARPLDGGMVLLVPLNLALLAWLPEHGVATRGGALLAALILAETAMCAWLHLGGGGTLAGVAWRQLLPFRFGFGALPQAGTVMMLASLVAALAAAHVSRSAFAAACAGAVAAFAVATHVPAATYTSSAFTLAAALMIALTLRDTGARGRR
ncbi:MAG: hypothetical protein IT529_02440 [Burkholderiales bacterium]|nr:hypothetical protein [Burkholderiales bacterium]